MVPGKTKALLLLCQPALVLAQTDAHPFLADKFYVQAGAFLPRIDFGANVDILRVFTKHNFNRFL